MGEASAVDAGFTPLQHAQLLLDVEGCIRESGGVALSSTLEACLGSYSRLLDPLAVPPLAGGVPAAAEREASLRGKDTHKIAAHLCQAFGGPTTPREAFLPYACVADESDSRPRLLLHTRPHFFPPHLVADLRGRRTLGDRVDFAMRLWLFDRQCALETVERLLLHRVQLIAKHGVEAAAHNTLVILTNVYLVRGLAHRVAQNAAQRPSPHPCSTHTLTLLLTPDLCSCATLLETGCSPAAWRWCAAWARTSWMPWAA